MTHGEEEDVRLAGPVLPDFGSYPGLGSPRQRPRSKAGWGGSNFGKVIHLDPHLLRPENPICPEEKRRKVGSALLQSARVLL